MILAHVVLVRNTKSATGHSLSMKESIKNKINKSESLKEIREALFGYLNQIFSTSTK